MNIKTVCLAFFLATTTGTVAAIAAVESPAALASAANENCEHVGNHYSRVSPTKETNGVKEYWVCCTCHNHYLVNPNSNGVGFIDKGTSTLSFNENIESDRLDSRFISPLSDNGGEEDDMVQILKN